MKHDFPTITIETDLQRFDAYIREQMNIMELVVFDISTPEDYVMTTGWDTTNAHRFYYEWHAVEPDRYVDISWGIDKGPKLVVAWLTATDYVPREVSIQIGCLDHFKIKNFFQTLVDVTLSTFKSVTEIQRGFGAAQTIEIAPLTPRETEIAMLLATSMDDDQIAEYLVIAKGTVKKHRQHISKKWGMDTEDVKAMMRESINRGYSRGK